LAYGETCAIYLHKFSSGTCRGRKPKRTANLYLSKKNQPIYVDKNINDICIPPFLQESVVSSRKNESIDDFPKVLQVPLYVLK